MIFVPEHLSVTLFVKRFFRFFLGSLVFFTAIKILCSTAQAQNTDNYPDPLLVNGKHYSFFTNNVRGHQFISTDNFLTGSLTIKGVLYEDQMLQYDIFNQQLILKYRDQLKTEKIIVVSDAWLTAFNINHQSFIVLPEQDSKKIYQAIGRGDTLVLYAWRKELKLNTQEHQYVFTLPLREAYVMIHKKFYRFHKNKSFARAFGNELESEILKYLRKYKIKVHQSNDQVIASILKHIEFIKPEL
jgi:hypothetical protein